LKTPISSILLSVNAEYDVRNNDLHVLITSALQADGVVSRNRRKTLAGFNIFFAPRDFELP